MRSVSEMVYQPPSSTQLSGTWLALRITCRGLQRWRRELLVTGQDRRGDPFLLHWWESLRCANGEVSVLRYPLKRYTWGSVLRIKTAGRKAASAEHFIKVKGHSYGRRADGFQEAEPPKLFQIGYSWVFQGWDLQWGGWAPVEAAPSLLGDSFHRMGEIVFDPTGFEAEPAWSLLSFGRGYTCNSDAF